MLQKKSSRNLHTPTWKALGYRSKQEKLVEFKDLIIQLKMSDQQSYSPKENLEQNSKENSNYCTC